LSAGRRDVECCVVMTVCGEMPMFPLGTVLFPHALLPVHVFEPRYRAMIERCLASGSPFGVVLIERGSEVGGGDVRTSVGCEARILDARRYADGRWSVAAVGTQRLKVKHWLPDEPWPRAEIEPWPDPEPGPDALKDLDAATVATRRVLALEAELGHAGPPATVEVSCDPLWASYELGALSPLSPFDKQAILASGTIEERLNLLAELLADRELLLLHELEMD
jgi:Lon protease-like protein